MGIYPLVNVCKQWKITIFHKWQFSIAMVVYQRVNPRLDDGCDLESGNDAVRYGMIWDSCDKYGGDTWLNYGSNCGLNTEPI